MAGYGRIFSIAGASGSYRNLLPNRNVLLNLQRCMALKAKVLEKLGIPPRPKKPLTPYFRFMLNERVKVKNENPSLGNRQIVSKVAHDWADYDPHEKAMLQKAYDLEMLTYSKQLMIYEQSITPEQKKMISDAKHEADGKAEKEKFRKKIEKLGKPKKPPTGFIQYMQTVKYSKNEHGTFTDWIRNVAEKWRSMTAEEKLKYENESKKLREQYQNDLSEWEQKMVRLGHFDVVRNRGLNNIQIPNSAANSE